MPATSKTELVAIAEKEFSKLGQLLSAVDPDQALTRDKDDTSLKDIVAHRAHWIELFLGWYSDGRAGKEVFFPAKGYKWNELKRYNADLRCLQADLSWQDAVDLLIRNHASLMALIGATSDEDLYRSPMKGANNAWTSGRWAEAAGPSHYRSASKYARARMKEMRG